MLFNSEEYSYCAGSGTGGITGNDNSDNDGETYLLGFDKFYCRNLLPSV